MSQLEYENIIRVTDHMKVMRLRNFSKGTLVLNNKNKLVTSVCIS